MRSSPGRTSVLLPLLCLATAVGCAGVKQNQGGGSGNAGTNGDGGPGSPDAINLPGTITKTCGNGMLDPGEQCDDGNTNSGDGCTRLCQIAAGFSCPTPNTLCTITAVCGDGKLESGEACDDGNQLGSDGCSADCKIVETGYECRVPGRKCVPACGDGMIIGSEQCDDGNQKSGDGCTATCLVEPSASCSGTPSVCKVSTCGNGIKEAGESCDCGTGTGALPTGCLGPNGLFFGDGTGCSKSCTQEPKCRDAAGKNSACDTSCGNGNKETGEECDDGNSVSGDGCSSACKLEAGFNCSDTPKPDTQACTQPGNTGQCLELPIIYRDFKSEHDSGGHPDFFYLGATISPAVTETGVQGQAATMAFSRRYCVSNSSGPAKKNDSVNRCWDLAQANLGPAGKPVFNATRPNGTNCDCQFIDWSHDTNGGHVPGYVAATNSPTTGLVYVNGAAGHPMYRGPAPIVSSAASFAQWWVDSPYTGSTHTVGTLEMGPTANGQYQFSSQTNSVTGGFFPLDPPGQFPLYGMAAGTPPGAIHMVGTEAMLCNLWPYWYSSAVFGAGNGCKGDQYLFPPSLLPPDTAALFPNGKWYGPGSVPALPSGWYHDSWFSDEARYLFNYNGAFSLQFYGDDDMYIFINGLLVVDLGGVHQRLPGLVTVSGPADATPGVATITEGGSLDVTGTTVLPCAATTLDPYTMLPFNALTNTDGNGHSNCTIANCDCRTRTVNLGLTAGGTYEIAVFGADRHPTESNYQLTLSGFATNRSNCMPRCGDGVTTGAEECDCGDATASANPACAGMTNNDTTYGGCTTMCKYGPYCGDGVVNGTEQCDLGTKMNTTLYGTKAGCTPGCTFPHYCGDAIVDDGEDCDLGPANGPAPALCSMNCKININ